MKLLLVALLVLTLLEVAKTQTKFVCYFPNWTVYRAGIGRYTVDNIDPRLCTHLIYAFATLDATSYTIKSTDPSIDINSNFYSKFNSLKQINPALKTLIAIGGWNDSQGSKYSLLVADPAKITTFVNSVVSFLRQYGFNGLDVDWEYPSSAADKTGFSNLLIALRSAFNQNGFLLSVAVGAGKNTIDTGYDVLTISQNVDFINLMTYDMHGPWESSADHHAPLYKRSWEVVDNNANFSINYWLAKGALASKLVLGIPLYGKSWKLASSVVSPPAPASGPGSMGPQTGEAGTLAYYEICNNIRVNGWKVVTDANLRMGPYAYSTTDWVGYDDPSMAATKAQYVATKGLGGAMVWDISMDDFTNLCGGGINPVMTAIARNLNSSSTTANPGSTTRITTATARATTGITTSNPATTTARPLTTTARPATSTTTRLPTTTARPPTSTTTRLPTTTARPATSTTTRLPTTTAKVSTTTIAPATFVCPSASGYFANPSNCNSFYICNFGQSVLMQCPAGLYFNQSLAVCDWPQNVSCPIGK